jgi:tRNA(Arg) A34 adenosine deaminase TadA
MKDPDLKFMRLAIAEAYRGVKKGQSPFGACIVKNGQVVALGHNTVWKSGNVIMHAEMAAISSACRALKTIDLSGCTVYSTCEPCPMCFSACHWARISRVVSGSAIKDAKRFGFNEMAVSNSKLKGLIKSGVKISSGVAKKENIALFEFWKKQGKSSVY